MSNFRIREMRFTLHFGSGVGYGPCGAVGQRKVESSSFRRKTEKDEERRESRHRYCITERSEFEKAGGLAVGA